MMAKIILLTCVFELILFSLPFIRVKSENEFLAQIRQQQGVTSIKAEDRVLLLPGGVNPPHINGGPVTSQQNINGYNPITPKRLLWIVNAAEGRPENHIESVSLNITKMNRIYELAGLTKLYSEKGIIEFNPKSNIYSGIRIIEGEVFRKMIRNNEIYPGSSNNIYVVSADAKAVTGLPMATPEDCSPQVSLALDLDYSHKIISNSKCDYYYVFPNLYYPGWRMTLEGDIIKPFPAFEFLQGYLIPSGFHEGSIKYLPTLNSQ